MPRTRSCLLPRGERASRRAIKVQAIQTQLIASDPSIQAATALTPINPPSATTTPADDDTNEALHSVGFRGGGEWYEENEDNFTFCICNKTVAVDAVINTEKLIRCGNRNCQKSWFHLTCINLPDHPPMRFGWMCPECIKAHSITESLRGLWDVKVRNDGTDPYCTAKEWLRVGEKLKNEKENRRRREAFWRNLGESDGA